MTEILEQLRDLAAGIRRKPAMYFGRSGSTAIPLMTRGLIDAVLATAGKKYSGPIVVSVTGKGRRQAISVEFAALASPVFSPARLDRFLQSMTTQPAYELGSAAVASRQFAMESCDGQRRALLEIQNGFQVATETTPSPLAPCLRVVFQPEPTVFDCLSHDGLYHLAGNLRDLSLLHPGLAVHFNAESLAGELRYFHQHGLKSLLFEDDHARWPLHPGCLSFKATAKDMRVEGHLRFLHAGLPFVRSYVNGHPTQGGAHLEGLGAALFELFPDPSLGCRRVPLITNPDTGAKIDLPHPFLAAMQVQLADPRYYGPTRDVLLGDEVREFVRCAASETLRKQWENLRAP